MAKTALNRRTKGNSRLRLRPLSQRSARRGNGANREASFPVRKSIEELAAEQRIPLKGQIERVLGSGAQLWSNDDEFRQFVDGIYARRRDGMSLGHR